MRLALTFTFSAALGACGSQTVSAPEPVDAASDVVVDAADARVDAAPAAYVTGLVLGISHQHAVMSDGTVRVRGIGLSGVLGTGHLREDAPTTIPRLSNVAEVVTSSLTESACARGETGALWCWGDNRDGLLGTGNEGADACDAGAMTSPCRQYPTRVPGIDDAVSIAFGFRTACAARRDGSVWCWGQRDGVALLDASELPTRVTGVSDVAQLWGLNGSWVFRHRDGHFTTLGLWRNRVIPPGAEFSAAPMAHFACYRTADARLRCMGQGPNGELGDGISQYPASRPDAVDPGLTRVRVVVAGTNHVCAVLDDGTLRCWGNGTDGALGVSPSEVCVGISGATACETTPVVVPDVAGVSRIFLGYRSTCILRGDHQVWCWGALAAATPTPRRIEW